MMIAGVSSAMKILAFAVCSVLVAADGVAGDRAGERVLIVVSNVADMGDPKRHEAKNNLWEVAPPYHVFVMHGYQVDFVSPKGGKVPFSMDVDQVDPPGMISYTIKYEGFRDKADHTLTPDQVDPAQYAAVFVGGGAGPLFDVANDPRLLSLMAKIYESGGVLGGCGHGPGSFSNVKLSTGEYLVRGKRVTGFPNSSEKAKKWSKGGTLLPFLVEDGLRVRNALYLDKGDLLDKHDVVVDQRLVTTMFLPSAAIVAEEMVRLLAATATPAGRNSSRH
jgi:putative intracellular protease/amidase